MSVMKEKSNEELARMSEWEIDAECVNVHDALFISQYADGDGPVFLWGERMRQFYSQGKKWAVPAPNTSLAWCVVMLAYSVSAK